MVPFIGVYSTPDHPLALVFEFMDNLNLGEYLRNNHDIGKVDLVRLPSSPEVHAIYLVSRRCQVLNIARAVKCIHNLGIVHGNIKIVCPSTTVLWSRAYVIPDQLPRRR